MSEIIRHDLPSVAALDAVLREREEARGRRENPISFLGDDEIEAALAALRAGDEGTVARIERRMWRRVEADLPGRRRLSPEVTRHNPGHRFSGHARCMAEGNPGADRGCACVLWFLDGPRDSRFHDPWAIHVHRGRVREQRRAIREAPAREVVPLLPDGLRKRRPVPVASLAVPVRRRPLLELTAASSAADARLPEIGMGRNGR